MSEVEAAATLQDYIDMWTHRKITPSNYLIPPTDENFNQETETTAEKSGRSDKVGGTMDQASDEGFEYVEGENETLPWKCAACEFMDPAKQVVVEHWQRRHGAQVWSVIKDSNLLRLVVMLRTKVKCI